MKIRVTSSAGVKLESAIEMFDARRTMVIASEAALRALYAGKPNEPVTIELTLDETDAKVLAAVKARPAPAPPNR